LVKQIAPSDHESKRRHHHILRQQGDLPQFCEDVNDALVGKKIHQRVQTSRTALRLASAGFCSGPAVEQMLEQIGLRLTGLKI
jgi:hypothetical protein